jgi:hypothetical protein
VGQGACPIRDYLQITELLTFPLRKGARLRQKNGWMQMRVTSKLADMDFAFGKIERLDTMLVLHSDDAQAMKTTVYMAPDDFLAFLKAMATSRGAWLFLLFFPYLWLRHRRSAAKGTAPVVASVSTAADDPW